MDKFSKQILYLRSILLASDFLLAVYVLGTQLNGSAVYSLLLLLLNVCLVLYSYYHFKRYEQPFVVQMVQKVLAALFVGGMLLLLFLMPWSVDRLGNLIALMISSGLVVLYPAANTYGKGVIENHRLG